MKHHDDKSTPCVIRQSAMSYARCAGLIDSSGTDPEECRIVESVRKLMALGLSGEEIEDLDIRQPMLQAICEYARLDDQDRGSSGRVADVVDAALKVIGDEMHSLELEIQMLNLRKRALKRRARVIEKLARSLGAGDSGLLAA